MKIQQIRVVNYRRHILTVVNLENDCTVIVGENDTGKSTIIEAVKIISSNQDITREDFHDESKPVEIVIYFKNGDALKFESSLDSAGNTETRRFLLRNISEVRKAIDSASELDIEDIKNICKDLGLRTGNSKKETLISNLQSLIEVRENIIDGRLILPINKTYIPNIYFLDGKSFQDVDAFIHETFIKEKQSTIWDEKLTEISPEISIIDYIQNKIELYKSELETDLHSHDIVSKLSKHISEIDGIVLSVNFERKMMNFSLGVNFSIGSRIMDSRRFGDGTRRRITLALLQYKVETQSEESIYILDEPDTHLHVKAQNDLLNIIDEISGSGSQVIITTHSPFLMNSASIRQIRLLTKKGHSTYIKQDITKVKSLEDPIESAFKDIGIENFHLFSSRRILIVEGETEYEYFTNLYPKLFSKPISRDFIRIVKRPGIKDVPRFTSILKNFVGPSDIFVVIDNDGDEETNLLIDRLEIKSGNIFRLGTKEFEDSFRSDILFNAWKIFVESQDESISDSWSETAILDLYEACRNNDEKFSSKLSYLNTGCKIKLTKPRLGTALANYATMGNLNQTVRDILDSIRRDLN